MDVSRGPTDNLYKFIALSGLALTCFGVVLVANLFSTWTTVGIDAEVSVENLNAARARIMPRFEHVDLDALEDEERRIDDNTPDAKERLLAKRALLVKMSEDLREQLNYMTGPEFRTALNDALLKTYV